MIIMNWRNGKKETQENRKEIEEIKSIVKLSSLKVVTQFFDSTQR